jgi:hypothetical protein
LSAVGSRAARRLLKDLLGSGGAKLLHLRVEALAVRARRSSSRNAGNENLFSLITNGIPER